MQLNEQIPRCQIKKLEPKKDRAAGRVDKMKFVVANEQKGNVTNVSHKYNICANA